ncbi:Reticulocyte-binding protein 2 a-like protein [Emericellopsis cladophorae]|uniref:Reticulocyte-binding protein 2 a-like protein n=1 Tax=Emericellopsis cladophorae TaxID=2686198 RepID=A0A9P9Y401_9HYPO|nr:Reticulocyte-binding protein 2 a-like protein [Emericellopsis cladophorae]KAI6783041.1 Reticulocyte-binding protein 2 a-like protein [Emericellopsis cladophorae]
MAAKDSHVVPTATSLGKGSDMLAPDPRHSSSQSLAPSTADDGQGRRRRTLLLIYIHGFYGNDQSFRSFPYHVHTYLRSALSESHVIHSKIYPRYKTYRALEVARDNFSAWLRPHEGPDTDVILVGHSMGGILAADIVLMPNRNPYGSQHPYLHRILGTISLDSPFLGLHPGIVVSGISSLFQSSPEQPAENQEASSSNTDLQLQAASPYDMPPDRQPTDPFFNQPFWNDNPFKEAPFVKRLMNFAKKHRSEGIVNATAKHVLSHLEYGGCLADYPGLRQRYNRLRELEDVDELELQGRQGHSNKARVRFVNYYTLSSGRKNEPKTPGSETPADILTPVTSTGDDSWSQQDTRTSTSNVSFTTKDQSDAEEAADISSLSSRHSTSKHSRGDDGETASLQTDLESMSLQDLDPIPMKDDNATERDKHLDLAPIPPVPEKPEAPDFEQYTDKDARKQAEREFKRVQKNYATAVKDRNKAIRERNSILEKRRKKAEKEVERQNKEDAKAAAAEVAKAKSQAADAAALQRAGTEQPAAAASSAPTADVSASASVSTESAVKDAEAVEAAKPKKSKKFCTLPKSHNGQPDPTWVDIYMDGVDEVGAHCGLFFPGVHYDRLVGDVGERVISWVQDDMTKRMILDMESEMQSPAVD